MNDPNLQKNFLIMKQKGLSHKDTSSRFPEDMLSVASNSVMLDNIEDIQMRVHKYKPPSEK